MCLENTEASVVFTYHGGSPDLSPSLPSRKNFGGLPYMFMVGVVLGFSVLYCFVYILSFGIGCACAALAKLRFYSPACWFCLLFPQYFGRFYFYVFKYLSVSTMCVL